MLRAMREGGGGSRDPKAAEEGKEQGVEVQGSPMMLSSGRRCHSATHCDSSGRIPTNN